MPTYEYACTECGHRLEAVQSFSDAPLTECPVCSGHLRKVFSAVGVVFKGSGFYRTDSRAARTGSGDGSSAKSDAKSDSTGDGKSGAKRESSDGKSADGKSSDGKSTPKVDPKPAAKSDSSTSAKTG